MDEYERLPRYSLGPARPLNVGKTCPRHKWNPISREINHSDNNLYCFECQMIESTGGKLEPIE